MSDPKVCLGHFDEHLHDLACLYCLDYENCREKTKAHKRQLRARGLLKKKERGWCKT